MPDNEITLKDLYEKLILIEAKLNDLTAGHTIDTVPDSVNPFLNPHTGLNDINWYRKTHSKDEGEV